MSHTGDPEASQTEPRSSGAPPGPQIVVVGSGHKVGSTWLLRLVRDACGLRAGEVPEALKWTGPIRLAHPDAPHVLAASPGRRIFKAHEYAPLSAFPGVRFVSIFRDPRDVAVSTAVYLSWLPEAQGGKGEAFAALSLQQRIRQILDEEYFLARLEQWHASGAFQVRYEDLLADPAAGLAQVLDFLGERPSPDVFSEAIRRNSFEAKAGRRAGEEDHRSFYRSGTAGDWIRHFDGRTIDTFRHARNGRWLALLDRMQYPGFD